MKRIDQLIEILRAIYLLQAYTEAHAKADPPTELEEWLDRKGVMRYLKIQSTTYYRWVKQGKLKPRGNIGRHRYFKADLREIFDRRQVRERG